MRIFDSIKENLGLSSVDMEDAVKYAQPKSKVKKIQLELQENLRSCSGCI